MSLLKSEDVYLFDEVKKHLSLNSETAFVFKLKDTNGHMDTGGVQSLNFLSERIKMSPRVNI